MAEQHTLPEICRTAGIEPRTGANWVKANLIRPDKPANGSGHAGVFSDRTLTVTTRLAELRSAGLGIAALRKVADLLYESGKAPCPACGGQIAVQGQGESVTLHRRLFPTHKGEWQTEPLRGGVIESQEFIPAHPNTPRAESREGGD